MKKHLPLIGKICAAVLSLGVLLSIAFLPLVQLHVVADVVKVDLDADITVPWIVRVATQGKTGDTALDGLLKSFKADGMWDKLGDLQGRIVLLVASLSLCVLLAVAIALLVFLQKQRGLSLLLSSVGLLSALTAYASASAIVNPIATGKLQFGDIIGGLGALVNGMIDVQKCAIGWAFTEILLIFLALVIMFGVHVILDYFRADMDALKKKKKKAAKR
ncbi:MAG: hypothetical protein LBN05_01130 [Oscillospiraceae bacterium]|nr:hypothetical protein [Oscillospiraceae bacterium]